MHVADILLQRKIVFTKSIEACVVDLRSFERQTESVDATNDAIEKIRIGRNMTSYEVKVKKIDRALQLLQEDRYGLCEHCDELINPERLKLHPEITECTECVERKEIKEKQLRH